MRERREEDTEHLSAPPGWGILDESADPAGHAETIRRLISAITASGDYQVIQRLKLPPCYHAHDGPPALRALYVDVETTGLEDDARIIQLAILPFDFSRDGRIFTVHPCESWLEDPGVPIPVEVSELTGLTDADVAGHRIDEARVAALLAPAVLVIAHNARFDRPHLEARFPAFCEMYWACSCDDIPWDEEGVNARRLEWLGYRLCGMFYDAHRADADVAMGVHVLAQSLPKSGRPALGALLDAARAKTVRVWAVGSDKSTRFALKKRGYRWNGGEDGRPTAWWREIPESGLTEEIAWLETPAVYGGPSRHRVQVFDARVRYSRRSEQVPFAN